jgi:hypothetical protein
VLQCTIPWDFKDLGDLAVISMLTIVWATGGARSTSKISLSMFKQENI